ncbi:MAG: hypothetical protein EBU23_10960, partial [Mycobacteriaceae bacterium]|nr:hypothetical protein [Mycobacteriaceae bacterium]
MSRYAALSRTELARLVPELLLIGQLIDRSGMAWCIQAFGRDEMVRIAIEEWAGSSPIYTRRMQRALSYEGDDVITIFKGLQLDIGAPPQFMDFRFTVHDRWHGEFHLDHCGALLDVEPMGPDYVRGMCHDIEDPTFDATAVATNPKAQVRPIHRPPRLPADRSPHCAWSEMHLLNLSFGIAVRARAGDDAALATSICTRQLTGIAGVAAERIRRALELPASVAGLERVLAVHPLLNPVGYVAADIEGGRLHVRPSPAHDDGAWIALCSPIAPEPVQAIATAVDPHIVAKLSGTATEWTARFEHAADPLT